jgi:hypothetical protein
LGKFIWRPALKQSPLILIPPTNRRARLSLGRRGRRGMIGPLSLSPPKHHNLSHRLEKDPRCCGKPKW